MLTTHEKIDKWYKERFPRLIHGRPLVAKRYKKMLEEVGELGECLVIEKNLTAKNTAHEIADVYICLYALARECGIDINAAVEQKLKILHRRLKK